MMMTDDTYYHITVPSDEFDDHDLHTMWDYEGEWEVKITRTMTTISFELERDAKAFRIGRGE